MNPLLGDHLTDLFTPWDVIGRARSGSGEQAEQARRQIAERYQGAIRRYLHILLKTNPALADEIASDVVVDLLEGKGVLRHAGDQASFLERPGSFRAYLRKTLKNKLRDRGRALRRAGRKESLAVMGDDYVADASTEEDVLEDELLRQRLREALLDRVWKTLAEQARDRKTGFICYALLKLQLEHRDTGITTAELAERLRIMTGKPITAASARKSLQRARERFAEIVIREVAASLGATARREDVEAELIELGLLNASVKKALQEYALVS